MGNTTFPLYIYELIRAVQCYEDEHPKWTDALGEPRDHSSFCLKQWLDAIPEEHRQLAVMLDDLKAYLGVSE